MTLKRIYIKASKEAGFTENDLPEFWYIVMQRWLAEKQKEYSKINDSLKGLPIGNAPQGMMIAVSDLLHEVEKGVTTYGKSGVEKER